MGGTSIPFLTFRVSWLAVPAVIYSRLKIQCCISVYGTNNHESKHSHLPVNWSRRWCVRTRTFQCILECIVPLFAWLHSTNTIAHPTPHTPACPWPVEQVTPSTNSLSNGGMCLFTIPWRFLWHVTGWILWDIKLNTHFEWSNGKRERQWVDS